VGGWHLFIGAARRGMIRGVVFIAHGGERSLYSLKYLCGVV